MSDDVVSVAEAGPPEDPRGHWPEHLQRMYEENRFNGVVGSVLVSESDRCRVWHLHLAPGELLAFHRHVLPYFWSATSAGTARGYYEDGRIVDVTHYPGQTRHFEYGPGDYMVHAVQNVGESDLDFVTVEFLSGSNPPLPIENAPRLEVAGAERVAA
ncbi:hypothetical protein [Sphingomonas corticis]|uniref:Cupin domain-containing protein n=1 Tax=Sphingomonas corticis TaxID=2722791 RepID=A0ABX1CWE5_9SPHN|nr:hypothetical protein [Sphingomonas corticis]NJR80605.1 hypothetical protein [Sphingomonas corticis]